MPLLRRLVSWLVVQRRANRDAPPKSQNPESTSGFRFLRCALLEQRQFIHRGMHIYGFCINNSRANLHASLKSTFLVGQDDDELVLGHVGCVQTGGNAE